MTRTALRLRCACSALATLVVVLAACGDGPAGDGPSGAGSRPAAGPLVSLLGSFPDAPDLRASVQLADWASARRVIGLGQPAPGAGIDEQRRYFQQLLSAGRFGQIVPLAGSLLSEGLPELGTAFGFAATDIDRLAVAGRPPHRAYAFEGRIDAGTVEQAVRRDPVWSPVLVANEHQGDGYFAWLADGALDTSRAGPTRPFGEALRLGVPTSGRAVVTTTDDEMKAALDAIRARRASLADVDAFRDVGTALDHAGVLAAVLSDQTISVEHATDPATAHGLGPYLEPWEALGVGVGVAADGQRRTMVVTLAYSTSEQASRIVEALLRTASDGTSLIGRGRPWRDLLAAPVVETEGRLVVGRFDVTANPGVWSAVGQFGDSLLLTSTGSAG
jgi:hypothetical protein